MVNVGQILRLQNRKENVYSVGFGTYKGTVIAADQWAEPFKIMEVPAAMKKSWEHAMHMVGDSNKLLIFDDDNRHLFDEWIGHRAIGVVYNPEFEAYGNYVPSKMGSRYDAFIYLEETKALKPIQYDNS